MRFLLASLILTSIRPCLALAQHERLNQMKMVRLTNGTTAVDLDGDGRADLVVRAWVENYNAHSYDILTFYIQNPRATENAINLVPFADSSAIRREAFRTDRGADCTLADLRLLKPPAGPAVIVIGRRDVGTSYADSLPVSFTVYRLHVHNEGQPGSPPYLFVAERSFQGPRKYCDVNDAFRAELGLGNYR